MSHSLLPQTKEKYESTFSSFLEWMKSKNLDLGMFSEDIFLTYFIEMSEKVTPNTLWSKYSMIKSIIDRDHSAVDMSKMTQLHLFLRNKAAGYKSKKTKVFSSDEIEKFIFTAPDDRWLAVKVVAIFGLNGACRGSELTNLTTDDVEKHGNMLLVKLTETSKKIRSFTISGDYFDIVQRYQALRPHRCWTKRFFLKYLNGKCSQQPIGKNKIASMPKLIAQYLKLPEPKLYTGYCFKRTSSKLLTNSGPSLHFVDVKPNSDWACDTPVDLIETLETESDIANSEDDSRSLSSTSDNSRLSGNHLESEYNFASMGNAQPIDANQTLHIEEIRINANRIIEPVTDANAREWLHKIMNLNNCSINTINIHIHSSSKNEAR